MAAEKGDGERVAARGCDGVDWRHGVGWVMRSKIGIDAHYATATKGFGTRRKQVSPAGSIAGWTSVGFEAGLIPTWSFYVVYTLVMQQLGGIRYLSRLRRTRKNCVYIARA